jgi:DNA-binding CsgD family transcriptional regulator/PAS domain-containing protein
MDEFGEALSITGAIYDAALDPGRWPAVLERIAGFVGGAAAALTSDDIAARRSRFHYSWGDDPRYSRLYGEKYIRLNPVLVPLMLLGEGEVRSASSLLATEKFRTTRFYKEWSGPAGYGDNTVAVIEKSPAVVTYLATPHWDRDSPVDGTPRRRMELIAPHVRRAVAIGNVIERHKVEADALADAVDAIAAGVFMVDQDGHLIHANASGRAMLDAGSMLRLESGALVTPGASDQRALAAIVADAVRGNLIVGAGGVAVPLVTPAGECFVAHVLPLTSGGRRARVSTRAAAAVFVHEAAVEGLLPLEAIAQQFGLSAGELRVLVTMMEVGGSVPEIAPVLGLAEPTVRTHLRRLFEKTGTRRQADLIKLVAGYASPLLARA